MAYLNCPTCRLTVYSPALGLEQRGVPALPGEARPGQPAVPVLRPGATVRGRQAEKQAEAQS